LIFPGIRENNREALEIGTKFADFSEKLPDVSKGYA
jgi:hypothetical protein